MNKQDFLNLCYQVGKSNPDWVPESIEYFQDGIQEFIGDLKAENSHLSSGLSILIERTKNPKTVKLKQSREFAINKLKKSRSLPLEYLNGLE